jgi:hypothetical protein
VGSKMSKDSVIYGAGGNAKAQGFNDWKTIEELIVKKIGSDGKYDLKDAKKALTAAENDKKMKLKDAYIKVGVVKKDLVFRVKEDRTLGDIEHDGVLVEGYEAAAKKFSDALEKSVAQLRINHFDAVVRPLGEFEKVSVNFTKELNSKNLDLATQHLTSMGQKINRAEELNNPAGWKVIVKQTADDFKIAKDDLKAHLEETKPFTKEESEFKKRFSEATNSLKTAKSEWQKLMDKASEGLDEPGKDDGQYKKDFNELMSAYKDVINELTKNGKAAENLQKDSAKFKDTALTVGAKDDFVDALVMDCFRKVKKLETDNAEAFNQIRENKDISGKPSLKKQVNTKMTKDDIDKKFGTLHSKGAIINQELIVVKREIQKDCILGLKAYIERFGKTSVEAKPALEALTTLVKK